MKKLIFFTASLIITTSFSAFSQNSKLSPTTKKYINLVQNKRVNAETPNRDFIYKKISNTFYLSSLIKTNNSINASDITNMGAFIGTKAGNIWTVQIPSSKIIEFIKIKGIDYIQLDEPVYFEMDSARHDANVDSVHAGFNLPHPFSGKNVVVGIIDAGFDYSHPAFLDTTGTKYRVVKVWEQKNTGNPPAGYAYGNELNDSTEIWNDSTDASALSHGSHVAGITAGSGIGSAGNKFRGVAYESDLIFIGIKPDPGQWTSTGMSNIIDGMNYVYEYANSVGKPAVVNLSWGCSIGSHDGESLFSQACDQLTGKGKIFVCSAGNNGDLNIHAKRSFSSSDTLGRTVVNFSSSLPEKKTWVDLWGEENQQICTSISLLSGITTIATSSYYCSSDSVANFFLLSANNDTCYITLTNSAAEQNNKPRCLFEIYNKSSLRVCINITSKSGTVHLFTGFVKDYSGYYGSFVSPGQTSGFGGDKNITISDFSATKSAIAVAAFATKNIFTSIDGIVTNYGSYVSEGNLAPFSSRGNTVDNRVKPDIAAPGLLLGSAINSHDISYLSGGDNRDFTYSCSQSSVDSKDYCYGMMMGTSMSSPMASGVIALMLEANPQLDADDLRYIFKQTAIKDNYTGALPDSGNYIWGLGKINAFKGVKFALDYTGVYNSNPSNENIIVYPNPANNTINIDCQFENTRLLTLKICSILGEEIISTNYQATLGYNHKTIDISNIPSGMYIVSLRGENTSYSYKLIKR
ncbi:MAG: S8/S53 family peptidase [Bacteroidota bacterium]